ncbi:MAG: hypothetical protein IPK04_06795 [Bdellovibrionales bacterium]|nr:hypothetical protein [Bdellovibrionales bacterium]
MNKMFMLGFVLLIGCFVRAEDSPDLGESKNQKIETETSPEKTIPKGKYITGGVLGSTLGFGLGHLIQDRYYFKGLLFSVTQAIGVGLLASADCRNRQNERNPRDRGDCADTMKALVGGGLWLGFHIWEVIDIWTGAKPKSVQNDVSVLFLPTTQGSSIMLSLGY